MGILPWVICCWGSKAFLCRLLSHPLLNAHREILEGRKKIHYFLHAELWKGYQTYFARMLWWSWWLCLHHIPVCQGALIVYSIIIVCLHTDCPIHWHAQCCDISHIHLQSHQLMPPGQAEREADSGMVFWVHSHCLYWQSSQHARRAAQNTGEDNMWKDS